MDYGNNKITQYALKVRHNLRAVFAQLKVAAKSKEEEAGGGEKREGEIGEEGGGELEGKGGEGGEGGRVLELELENFILQAL